MSLKDYLNENITTITSHNGGCNCDLLGLVKNVNENDEDFIKNLKKYDLRARYDYWHKKLFDNKLPHVDTIKFLSLRNKGATGICNAKVEFVDRSKKLFKRVWDSKIILDNRHKYTQKTLDSILIHEMIHWHFIGYLKINEDHGMSFKSMASKLSKIVGFEIPIVDNITTIEDREEELPTVGIVLIDRGDRFSIMFTSKNNFEKKIAELLYRTLPLFKDSILKDSKITYGLGKFSKINQYPLLRSFKKLKTFSIDYDDAINNISWERGSAKEIYLNEL